MREFGPNGIVVATGDTPGRDYATDEARPKIRRVLLACFLCGICASISVALIAAITAFTYSSVTSLFGQAPAQFGERDGFLSGAFLAVMMSAFNWMVFYAVVPITWLVMAVSIGRFPRRGIVRPMPYYRWGAIWGAILVSLPTLLFSMSMGASGMVGALLTSVAIGALAGLICASLFMAIVRPESQIRQIATDVF